MNPFSIKFFQDPLPLKILKTILAKITRMEQSIMTLEEQATALQADVTRVLGDQAAVIKTAVTQALADQGVHEQATQAILQSTQDAIDAFDPPPVTPAPVDTPAAPTA